MFIMLSPDNIADPAFLIMYTMMSFCFYIAYLSQKIIWFLLSFMNRPFWKKNYTYELYYNYFRSIWGSWSKWCL